MPLYMKMSANINETTRHLKFRYILILTNLLRNLFTNFTNLFLVNVFAVFFLFLALMKDKCVVTRM